jgi:thioredoxin-like negative regulator of GroEL
VSAQAWRNFPQPDTAQSGSSPPKDFNMSRCFARPGSTLALVAALLAHWPAAAPAAPSLPSANVAWLPAAADADIERAFALARSQKKPVLLYWGATWCPPCNQLKATLFNRQDFASQARSFIAVHVDGDRPGAQRLGQRFKVSGYPTLVLLSADGAEITRLPGEVDAAQVLALMQLGLSGGRPVKAVLADALAGKSLSANEWKLLAYYSWETDESSVLPKDELAATLARLAKASPADDGETTTRLWLKALAASEDDKSGQALKPDAALQQRVQRVVADPALTRAQMDVLSSSAAELVRALSGDAAPEKSSLLPAFDAALQRLVQDGTLSRGDRLMALISRVELARLGLPKESVQVKLPEALLKEVREQVARDDREISDGHERQAVITEAAFALGLAGLWSESDALLKSNLARSHSPYYLMSQLGSNAKKQGRNDEALRWFEQAFELSEGPATRLQWGSSYLAALVDLSPADATRIEKTAGRLLAEAAKDPAAFEGRSARSLQRMGKKLLSWNADGKQAAVLKRLQARLDGLCGKLGTGAGQRAACLAMLNSRTS